MRTSLELKKTIENAAEKERCNIIGIISSAIDTAYYSIKDGSPSQLTIFFSLSDEQKNCLIRHEDAVNESLAKYGWKLSERCSEYFVVPII